MGLSALLQRRGSNRVVISAFEPLRDEARAVVDVHLPEPPRTRIDELVGYACRDNGDLPRLRFNGGCTNRIGRTACLDDKDFFIGMLVQLWAFSGRHIHQDYRHASVSMQIALELIGVSRAGEFIRVDDGIGHACLLYRSKVRRTSAGWKRALH